MVSDMQTSKMQAIVATVEAELQREAEAETVEIVHTEWPNDAEHQEWLETASVEEIADWVVSLINAQ